MLTEAQVHRYNKKREPTEAKLFLLSAPCPECHGGTAPFAHGDDCAECQGEGLCECPDFCEVCNGAKRLPVRDQRVTRFAYPGKVFCQ
jgi:hypothetical protein